mgnify:CR=1 FL=1
MEQLHEIDYEDQPVRQRKPVFEPKNPYDFCKVFSSITGRPLGLFLKETKGWPMDWLYSIQSECKLKKTEVDKAKYINWFIKESRAKETNLKNQ